MQENKVVQFLPRNAMHSAAYAMLSEHVCPSVRLPVDLSHAGILSKRLNVSSNFFSPPGSHTVLVSWDGNIPTGTLLTGASNATGMIKSRFLADNRAYALSRKMIQNRAIVRPTMECE